MIIDTLESLVRYARLKLAENLAESEDKTIGIACSGLFSEWKPGKYYVGDVRTSEGRPYECLIEHDSTVNSD